jgi:hypothetical protein
LWLALARPGTAVSRPVWVIRHAENSPARPILYVHTSGNDRRNVLWNATVLVVTKAFLFDMLGWPRA